jgi:AraC-like DNA-binding protein
MPRKPRVERLKNIRQEYLRMKRGATVIGDILYAPGGACGPRYQHDFQLVVIHQGCLDLWVDGKQVHIGPDHGILLSPGHREHFLFSTDRETHHSWCAIAPRAVPRKLWRDLQSNRGPIPFAGRMLTLLEMSRRAQPAAALEEPLQEVFYLGLGLALFSDFALAARSGAASNSAAETLLAKMEQFIWEQHARPLSLRDIAQAVGVSRQHLLKLCRLRGKATPMTQLYAARLQVATDLLRQTGLSVNDIAEKCGFVNIYHFSRKFKETYGLSPGNWRKGLWQFARA